MAPRRKHVTAPPAGREFKLRIPQDVSERIEAKAKREGRPQNRVIINELALFPSLEETGDLADLIRAMEVIVARYGARITWHDLSDELLNAVDVVLKAEGGALQAALDRLRVVRSGMLLHKESEAKRTAEKPKGGV